MNLKVKNKVTGAILYWQYQHGKNRSDLARLLGVAPETLRYWEIAGRPSIRHAKRFSELTGVDFGKEYLKD